MRSIMLCCSRMPLVHTTEKMASVSGPFAKWSSRKTIKRDVLARVFLFASAYSIMIINMN